MSHSPRARFRALSLVSLSLGLSLALVANPSAQTSFTDVTAASGITAVHTWVTATYTTSSAAAGDFNGDGWQDLLVQNGVAADNALYVNDGDGSFTDRAAAWGVQETYGGDGATVGDYDGDGWLDVYVQSRGPLPFAPGLNKLYHNDGGAGFSDRALLAGVETTSLTEGDGFGPAFGDMDLDGDLDLFTTGWELSAFTNQLYRNEGNGTFTNITASLPVDMSVVQGSQPEFVDMDGDRYPELIVSADFGTSVYLANNGDGTFTDLTGPASGWTHYFYGMGTAVADFDANGWLDIYLSSIYFDHTPNPGEGNILYLSDGPTEGPHRYTELNTEWGVDDAGFCWGIVPVDFDHDGWVDLVTNNGWDSVSEFNGEPVYAFRNQGGSGFQEVGAAIGLDVVVDGRGILRFDHDNDGDMDVLVSGRGEATRLMRNELAHDGTHNWLRVFLHDGGQPGVAPNGYQSTVVVKGAGPLQTRPVNSGGSELSVNELSAHFGLGSSPTAPQLEVRWPDGHVTTLLDVPANQTLDVTCCGAWEDLGAGLPPAGSFDAPQLVGVGDLTGGSSVGVLMDGGLPTASAWIVVGFAELNAPFKGGTLVPDVGLGFFIPLPTDGEGALSLSTTWPGGIPAGVPTWFQVWVQDPEGPKGFTASNAVKGTTP
jgi:hypothetical protein